MEEKKKMLTSKWFCIFLFVLSIAIASYSQIILKKGAGQKNIYINKYTIVGYSLMVLSTVLTLIGYKMVSLTLSGILQALSFVFVPILSYILLKEKIDKKTIIGIIVIICGIVIYSI